MSSVHKQRRIVRERLVRAEGHLHGIVRMVDEEKECPDILLQITAVKAALEKVGLILLEDHLEHCIVEALKTGNAEPQLESFKAALEKMIR
jgi:DNA-binding FrmR family transcriptional regulator